MNIIKDGIIKIYHDFVVIHNLHKNVAESLRHIAFVQDQLDKFKLIGFKEIDVECTFIDKKKYQFEAESDNIYLEIEIDLKYFKDWEKEFNKKFN